MVRAHPGGDHVERVPSVPTELGFQGLRCVLRARREDDGQVPRHTDDPDGRPIREAVLDSQVQAIHVPGDCGFVPPSHGQFILADGHVLMGRGRLDGERERGHEADGDDDDQDSSGCLHGIPLSKDTALRYVLFGTNQEDSSRREKA